MNTDLRQSPENQELLRRGGCIVKDLGGGEVGYVFRLKIIPFVSVLIIQCVEDPIVLPRADKVSRQYRSLFIKIAPKAIVDTEQASLWEQALIEHGYSWDKSAVIPTKTLIVDLGLSEEDLLGQMKAKTRYNTRLAQRRGATANIVAGSMVFTDLHCLDEFYTMFYENCLRIGAKSLPRKAIENTLDVFRDNFFVVYVYLDSGELGAVASYAVTSDTIWYGMSGSTEKGRRNFATNLAVWEGMLEGKRRGCRWLDFDGIFDERYGAEGWKGFTRFKVGFGGEEVTYLGSYIKRSPFLKRIRSILRREQAGAAMLQ